MTASRTECPSCMRMRSPSSNTQRSSARDNAIGAKRKPAAHSSGGGGCDDDD